MTDWLDKQFAQNLDMQEDRITKTLAEWSKRQKEKRAAAAKDEAENGPIDPETGQRIYQGKGYILHDIFDKPMITNGPDGKPMIMGDSRKVEEDEERPKAEGGPATFAWDESQHPRQPQGVPVGGEFKEKGAADAAPGAAVAEPRPGAASTALRPAPQPSQAPPPRAAPRAAPPRGAGTEDLEAATPAPRATYPASAEAAISPPGRTEFDDRVESATTVAEIVAAIKAHPEYAAIQQKVQAAAGHLKNPSEWSKLLHSAPDGRYTPETEADHEKFIATKWNPKALPPPGKQPVIEIIFGPPGVGKSTAGLKYLKKKFPDFEHTYVSADDPREAMKEYRGWNSALLHAESADIAYNKLLARALTAGHNIILDVTGRDPDAMQAEVDQYYKRGYEVRITHVQASTETALRRSWERYVHPSKPLKSTGRGRYVPPDMVATVDERPDETYARLKPDTRVAVWRRLTTEVSKEKGYEVLEEGSRTPYDIHHGFSEEDF